MILRTFVHGLTHLVSLPNAELEEAEEELEEEEEELEELEEEGTS